MKKLVILLVLLAAAGTAVWLIYRKTPSGPEDKAVLYGNVDLRQVDLAFLISERIDSVLVDEGDTVVPGQKLATLETVRLRQAADEARQIAEAARQNYLRVKNGPRAEEIAQARANVQAAEATLNNAGMRSKRLEALAATKSISRQEADDAVASRQVAAANLDVARKRWNCCWPVPVRKT
ncbi:MAG: hypothetical protein ACLT38_00670 [Akkermansia sp.]